MFTISSVAGVALVYREFDCMTRPGPAVAFPLYMQTLTGATLSIGADRTLLLCGPADVVADVRRSLGQNVSESLVAAAGLPALQWGRPPPGGGLA